MNARIRPHQDGNGPVDPLSDPQIHVGAIVRCRPWTLSGGWTRPRNALIARFDAIGRPIVWFYTMKLPDGAIPTMNDAVMLCASVDSVKPTGRTLWDASPRQLRRWARQAESAPPLHYICDQAYLLLQALAAVEQEMAELDGRF